MKATVYVVKSRNRRKYGSECSFYRLGNRGLKCYTLKRDALFSFRTQKKLSRKGLAPKVFCDDVFRVEWGPKICRWKGWAYWTQIADTRVSYSRHGHLFNDLEIKLQSLGYDGDSHFSNVGFVKIRGKKKLVLIDTGPFCKNWVRFDA